MYFIRCRVSHVGAVILAFMGSKRKEVGPCLTWRYFYHIWVKMSGL